MQNSLTYSFILYLLDKIGDTEYIWRLKLFFRCYASPSDNFTDLDSFFENLFHKLDYKSLSSSQEKLLGCFPVAVPYLVVPRDIQVRLNPFLESWKTVRKSWFLWSFILFEILIFFQLQVDESLNELESNEIQYDVGYGYLWFISNYQISTVIIGLDFL